MEKLHEAISEELISFVKKAINGSLKNAYTTEVNNAVESQVKDIKETLKKQSDRAIRMAELRADVRAVCFLLKNSIQNTNAKRCCRRKP